MLFHTLAFNARTDRRFRRTVRIALLLLAGQMFPAAGATAEDRIGSGSVTVSDGQIYDNVYGDRSEGGDAASSGSRVSVIGGTVHREVYGGFAGTANGAASARGGSVNISGGLLDGDFGNNIYGGYAQSSNGNAVAEANSVVLDGTASLNVEKYIYGGYAQGNGSAASRVATRYNEISLGNGTVENIYGGYANDGPEFNGVLLAVENSVLVTGGTVTNVVYGGKADSDFDNTVYSRADRNLVTVTGGTLEILYGGKADSDIDASADGNIVEISGGRIHFPVGGDAVSEFGVANADNNSVFISGGSITGAVIGGSAESIEGSDASSSYNTVSIQNAAAEDSVSGGLAQSARGGAVAGHNSVIIGPGASAALNVHGGDTTGGGGSADFNRVTVYGGGAVRGDIYGGKAESAGSASHNVLLLNNGTAEGDIYGGDGGIGGVAVGNSVIIGGATQLGAATSIYGGAAGTDNPVSARGSGNTLFLDSWQGSARRAAGFEYLHFVLPRPGAPADVPMLTLTDARNGDFDGTSVTVQMPDIMTGGRASVGDSFTLIRDDSGAVDDIAVGSGALTLKQGLAVLFDGQLTSRGQSLTFDLVNFRANPQLKALNEARAAALGSLIQGADLIADEGMRQARAAAQRGTELPGWAAFAAISGSGMRYHTGSHADVTGFSLMTGAARNFPAPDGDFLLGAFFELGYASLGTFNSSEPGDINGRGHSRYLGGGLLTRFDVSASPLRGLYAEAAFRTGRLKMSWNSDDLTDNMDRAAAFDTSSPYYGGHAGMGYVRQITEKLRADTHIRYFWTRQDGQGTDMLGDRFDFDDADSHRLRLGTRLEYEASEGIVPYVGAAWEHEFDGTTRSSVAFYALDTPSVSMRGDSGVFDLGLDMKPASLPLTLSAGLRGSVGAREGIGGHMNVVFRF